MEQNKQGYGKGRCNCRQYQASCEYGAEQVGCGRVLKIMEEAL